MSVGRARSSDARDASLANPMNEVRTEDLESKLSVLILTYNEEKNLPACLESVEGLDCEVFVVDSHSTDRTREIAKAATVQVVEHPFENYAAQRNWAQKNLPIATEWVLHLDADERLTPELVSEIRETLKVRGRAIERSKEQGSEGPLKEQLSDRGCRGDNLKGIDGFLLSKRTFFMGRWIRHGGHYPSYHLRLFRLDKGFCEERLYDQHFVVKGNIQKLKHDYIDILSSDLNSWTLRHLRWADLEARQLLMDRDTKATVRPALFGNPIERKRWLRNGPYEKAPLYVRPFLYWVYRYFLCLGFLDGKEGFIFHFLQGFWFRLLVDIKLDELRREQRSDQRSEVGDHQRAVGVTAESKEQGARRKR
jgi:glycosyltransferase involved in cell wall biosynthesis